MMDEIRTPRLLGRGCVLQRGPRTRIWGWYLKNRIITASFQGKTAETRTEEDGSFELFLDCRETGGPFVLELNSDDGRTKILDEIYVGDVFVCSGQSNMELPVRRVSERYPEELRSGGCAGVHHYKVKECVEFIEPLEDHKDAEWNLCVGDNLPEVSALAYFFGCMIYEKEQVPVGLINISLGGSPIEAWMSVDSLSDYPELLESRKEYADPICRNHMLEQQEKAEQQWHQSLRDQEKTTCDAEWKEIHVPGYFQEQGLEDFCGLLHLRYTFYVSEKLAGTKARLRFGTMIDNDETYINGVLVGETGYSYPPRRYEIPEGLLRSGENEILIRLSCRDGNGRITPDKPYEIVFPSGEIVPLEGIWQYQVRAVSEPAPVLEFLSRRPSVLFQGMTAPCLPFQVKAVLWYQGESNDRRPESYEKFLKEMIRDWRHHWKQEQLPFIIIQLPACQIDNAGNGAWAIIREAQKRASELPLTAVTANLDLGEYNDLHPTKKKEVAYRAFLAARHLVYGENLIWQGPELTGYELAGDGLYLDFDTKDGKNLRLINGEYPGEFEIAEDDGVFCPVSAEINKTKIRIMTESFPSVKAVRYAWSNAPLHGLLCNEEGIPALPFYIELDL